MTAVLPVVCALLRTYHFPSGTHLEWRSRIFGGAGILGTCVCAYWPHMGGHPVNKHFPLRSGTPPCWLYGVDTASADPAFCCLPGCLAVSLSFVHLWGGLSQSLLVTCYLFRRRPSRGSSNGLVPYLVSWGVLRSLLSLNPTVVVLRLTSYSYTHACVCVRV